MTLKTLNDLKIGESDIGLLTKDEVDIIKNVNTKLRCPWFYTPINRIGGVNLHYHIGEKIKNSIEGTWYYQDIFRERFWQKLTKTLFMQNPSYKEIADSLVKENLRKLSIY